jgi:hypothetical protein
MPEMLPKASLSACITWQVTYRVNTKQVIGKLALITLIGFLNAGAVLVLPKASN